MIKIVNALKIISIFVALSSICSASDLRLYKITGNDVSEITALKDALYKNEKITIEQRFNRTGLLDTYMRAKSDFEMVDTLHYLVVVENCNPPSISMGKSSSILISNGWFRK